VDVLGLYKWEIW